MPTNEKKNSKNTSDKMRKAQQTTEFLMTYGWAILIVLAAIGALLYFGVITPQKLGINEKNETNKTNQEAPFELCSTKDKTCIAVAEYSIPKNQNPPYKLIQDPSYYFQGTFNIQPLGNDTYIMKLTRNTQIVGCNEGEKAEPVTCDCAKNTSTPCMSYCFECKKASW
jgi:hypothetical protein